MPITPRTFRLSELLALLGLFSLLVGLVVMVSLPGIRYAAWGTLFLGILLLSIALIVDFRQVGRAVTGRRGRFSTGTTVMASTFIGIIFAVNAISLGNYQRFDFTGLAQFTLTSQTQEVLRQMKTPVDVLGFFTPNDPYGIASYAANLLREYQNYTDQLNLKIIDPEEHPDQARRYGVQVYPTIVFESQDQRRLVLPWEIVITQGQEIVALEAEHVFTSAILEVTGVVQKKLYFLTGHGENSIGGDYGNAREALLDNLYKVDTLDLLRTPAIPDDAAALIIAGPQRSLSGAELDIIKRYLDGGGWAMILANPNSPPEINQLVSGWGVNVKNGTVIDPSSYVAPNKGIPSVPRTKNFFDLTVSYFPESAALVPQDKIPDYLKMQPLVWTSPDSWLEMNFDPNQESVFNDGIDSSGSFALGVLIYTVLPSGQSEQTLSSIPDTRLVVYADSDFAANQHFYNGNNGELFLNSVNLLTQGKELISIERKVLPFRRLVIGPEATRFINYSSIGLLPLVVLAVGGIIWWRRR